MFYSYAGQSKSVIVIRFGSGQAKSSFMILNDFSSGKSGR